MVRVAPIKLQYNPKTLWFNPKDIDVRKGDAVVVSTVRGLEFGYAVDDIIEVDEKAVKELKAELKPVERLATAKDKDMAEKMQQKSEEALPIFKEMAAEANEEMHPVSVEYLLDGDKAVFYFEAEDRVDFRELVRKLASQFHVRIDMRQIGVRDEARMIGGIGHCGQELCCKRLGGEFCPVSIRMAKEQDLSLNPQKISGVCGRLMCCLRYEFDAYKDFKDRAPKVGAAIETPQCDAKVVDLNVPREIVTIKLEDDPKPIKIPLAEMEVKGKGPRPNKVSADVIEKYSQTILGVLQEASLSPFSSNIFTHDSSTFDEKSKKKEPSGNKGKSSGSKKTASEARKPRRRTRVDAHNQDQIPAKSDEKNNATSKQKSGSGEKRRKPSQKKQGKEQKTDSRTQKQDSKKQALRPGQNSSSLRKRTRQPSIEGEKPAVSRDATEAGAGRKARRRSHKAGNTSNGSADES